jgi:CheY-like chemotaxis protein
VLIAEDDVVSLRVLLSALVDLGHDVSTAGNGAAAWEIWQRTRQRIVISDWAMPELDGLELCRRIRERPGELYTYFILLTTRSGRESHRTASEAEVDDFLAKPLDREDLQARLRVAERIFGLRREVQQLEGLLSICAWCKRIRDERGAYSSLERYIEKRSRAEFSHGVCPECYEKHLRPQIEGPLSCS